MHPKTETPQPGYGTETFEMLVRQNPEYKHTNVDRPMNLFVFFFFVISEDECSPGAPAVGDHVQLFPGTEPGYCPSAYVLRPLQSPRKPGRRKSHGTVRQAGLHGNRRGTGSYFGMCRYLVTGEDSNTQNVCFNLNKYFYGVMYSISSTSLFYLSLCGYVLVLY